MKKCSGLFIAVGMSLALSACASSQGYNVNVVRYPDFWATPDAYHSMGVTAMVNDIDPGRYVKAANKQIVQGLKDNGTYQVTDLTNIDKTDEAIASVAGQVELVLVPTIVSIDEDDTEKEVTDGEGRKITLLYRYGAAELQASLYDPNTKDEVVSKTYTAQCDSEGAKKSELESLAKLKQCAVTDVTNRMINDLVVTTQSIYFSSSISLLKDGKASTKFESTDTINVSINLPEKATFNNFVFAIQDQETGATVISEDFVWVPDGSIKYSYAAKDVYAKGNGVEKFKAVILSNGNLAYSYEFKVAKPAN